MSAKYFLAYFTDGYIRPVVTGLPMDVMNNLKHRQLCIFKMYLPLFGYPSECTMRNMSIPTHYDFIRFEQITEKRFYAIIDGKT